MDRTRDQATRLVESTGGEPGFTDTNYIFLSFVTKYLPVGLVGLIIAVIFAATMSASAGEINSLATVTMVDLYRRYFHRSGTDHHYLMASRWATVFWGAYAIAFAGWGRTLGSLIVAVNKVGSLFYGSLLGVFVLAFFFRRVGGTAAFVGMLVQRNRLRGSDRDGAGGGARVGAWNSGNLVPSVTWTCPISARSSTLPEEPRERC
jgi:Na+/proline symporter